MLSKFDNIGVKTIAVCLPKRIVSILDYASHLIATAKDAKSVIIIIGMM